MAAFASMASAESRAKILMGDGSALVAHAARTPTGTICVRVLRPCSLTGYGAASLTVDGENKGGAWDLLTDDNET